MTDHRQFARAYLGRVRDTLALLAEEDIAAVLGVLDDVRRRGATLFLAGNGGSAATANHMANDLMLGVAKQGGAGFRVVSLSANVAVMTALANDEGFEQVFSGQLRTQGEPGDVLVIITGSGNSPNLLRACEAARRRDMAIVGLLGMDGGAARALCDVAVTVPSFDYGVIEALHLVLDHLVTDRFCQPLPDDG